MTTPKENTKYMEIKRLLNEGRLNDAFRLLEGELDSKSKPELRDRISNLRNTYQYMIHYLLEGYEDAGREDMLADIVAELHQINDIIRRNAILPSGEDIYSSVLRFENIRKASFRSRVDDYLKAYPKAELAWSLGGDKESEKETEEALSALFAFVWTMFGAPAENYRELARLVRKEELPYSFKAQIISALLLGNLQYFDREALIALIDIYEAELSPKISARALVAIFMIVAANNERIEADRALKNRFTLWLDSIMIYPRLREVLMSIVKARDTERINKKMQNELLPEIMKLRPEIIKKLKNASEEMDMETLEENPEWEDLLNKNGIGDKLKELTEIQLDGGDVMMMAFSNLKSFPFFNTVSNWFLPFSSSHSEVAAGDGSHLSGFAELLDMEWVMCDSDKFSFALSLNQMPEAQRKMMSERLTMEMGQLKEIMEERKTSPGLSEFDSEVTRYVRNLYRFFKLFRRKNDFNDPFGAPVNFRSLPFLSEILSDPEIIGLVGEFYFKRGYYKEALPLLLSLEKNGGDASHLWEKIGYCYNALNDMENALIWYRKAELLNPDSLWLIKKLALVSRILKRPQEAIDYYNRALEKDPDNFKLLISTANACLEADMPEEALRHYYHADYLRPDHLSTKRAIAWGEIMKGAPEKSRNVLNEIITSGNANFNDFLNMGHANLLLNNLKEAARNYALAISDNEGGDKQLMESIREDLPVLLKAGVDQGILNLVLDSAKFNVLGSL